MKAISAFIAILALGVQFGDPARAAAGPAATSQPKPALTLARVAGYQVAAAGRHWGAGSRVTVTVRAGSIMQQTSLQATSRGAFLVGITGLDGCATIVVSARDGAGHSRSVRPQGLQCAGTAASFALQVLKGQRISSSAAGWQTYSSRRDGFAVEYPSSWIVQEEPASSSGSVTTFSGGGGGFAVSVFPSVPSGSGDETRVGNVYCHEVTVAGLPARQCLDTIAFTRSTSLSSRGKTYVISAGMRRTDPKIYEHALTTFRLLG